MAIRDPLGEIAKIVLGLWCVEHCDRAQPSMADRVRGGQVDTGDPCGRDIDCDFAGSEDLTGIIVYPSWFTEGIEESWAMIKSNQKLWVGKSYPVAINIFLEKLGTPQLLLLFITNYFLNTKAGIGHYFPALPSLAV